MGFAWAGMPPNKSLVAAVTPAEIVGVLAFFFGNGYTAFKPLWLGGR